MNKEYTYLNGECIIEDENGKKKLEEYTNKTDEILIQENVIETLQKDLYYTKNTLEKKLKRQKSIKSDKWFNLTLLVMPVIAFQLAFRLLLGPNASEVMVQMNPLLTPFVKGLAVFFSITFGGLGFLTSFINGKEIEKSIRGFESKKEAQEKTLEAEKQHLEKLNQEKQKQESSEKFFTKEVDDLETLNDMRKYIGLYYDCGVNREKYEKYYQEGTLEKKLSKYYPPAVIKLIKEWLEQKSISEKLQEELEDREEIITRKLNK